MPELSYRQATAATATAQAPGADLAPGKAARTDDLPTNAAPSPSAISRVKAYAGETISDGAGFSYVVLDAGTFKVTAAPSGQAKSMNAVIAPSGRYASAWVKLAQVLFAKPPVKAAKPDAGAQPAAAVAPGAEAPAAATSTGFSLPSLSSMFDAVHSALAPIGDAMSSLFDFSDAPAAANAPAPTAAAGPEPAAAAPGDPQLAQQSTMDGNLDTAKQLADSLSLPHSYNISDEVKATDLHDGARRSALIAGQTGDLKSIVCSEFTTLTLAKSGVDMSQRYRDKATGMTVAWRSGKSVAFADLYGVTGNLWQHTTAILAAQHGAYDKVEPGSDLAKELKTHETETFLLVSTSAGAVDVTDGDSFGAGAVAQSLGGTKIEMKDRRPGDLQQRLATIDGKTTDGTYVGAGHSSQVWAVRGLGTAYLGATGSPTLHTTKAADIPPGWYALDGVLMEIDPMTDPATIASIDVTWVQLIDANTKGTKREDGKTLRGGDATSVGELSQAKTYTDKGASDLISAGRLPTSKWSDWKPTAPAVIGTITPDGVK